MIGSGLFTQPVISASGVCRLWGSGEVEGAGVGRAGTAGIAEARRVLRIGAALFLRGLPRFDGDEGSLGARLAFGSKIWEGSMLSPVLARLPPRADFAGEVSRLAVVCLLTLFLGLFFGTGVNSSSSSRTMVLLSLRSSSDSSKTTGRRAARRAGLVGDIDAIDVNFAMRLSSSREMQIGH